MPAAKTAKKTKSAGPSGLSEDEKSAIREHVRELRAANRGIVKPDGETEVLQKISEMQPRDRAIAKKVHAIVKAAAPTLTARTWYGMPAYAKGPKVVIFLQPAQKFKVRYAMLGFNDSASLDEGDLWPVAYAVNEITPAVEAKITAIVKKAAG